MTQHRYLTTALATALLTLGSGFAAHAGKPVKNPDSSTPTTYAGRAIGIKASLTALGLTVPLTVSDTGELDPAGGMRDASLLTLDTPQPLQIAAGVVSTVTVGSGTSTDSSASTVALDVNLAQLLEVSAGVLQANAVATCVDGRPVYSGSANVTDLIIANKPIAVTGAPNQTINLAGLATITINEQFMDAGRLVVNALHIRLGGLLAALTTADVVISHASAGINCGSVVTCPVRDFVTGGGFITLPTGAKGTFGFVGGQRANGLQGHLQYNDHSHGGPILRGNTVTAYAGSGTARSLTYGCTVAGAAASCQLDVADNGEPGGGVDDFAIAGGGYSASGPKLGNGNIQLHKPNCPSDGGGSTDGGGKGGKGGGRR